jgi:phosphoglycolate phosphatase-like HAD superfamily hydrolase
MKLIRLLPILCGLAACTPAAPADPLPSWNAGPTKTAILDFVARVTTPGSPDFVPVAERIATFDNDGTLWQEKPIVEAVFLLTQLKGMAEADPSLMQRPAVQAALTRDKEYFHEHGPPALLELFALVYGDRTEEEFTSAARRFLAEAKHPTLDRKFTALTYQPMLELLAYLRANGFQTWISSGGTRDFMRVVTDSAYGIPPEQVIGSAMQLTWKEVDGKWTLWREPKLQTINDQGGKPVNISLALGRPPILAAGNEGGHGDIAMLTYSSQHPGATLQLLVDHDDAEREFAYQEPDSGSLKAAAANGWTVISMKHDWKTVFRP